MLPRRPTCEDGLVLCHLSSISYCVLLYVFIVTFLGDPGAVSGGREISKRARKKNSGVEKSRTKIRAPGDKVLKDQFQTVGVILASDWCQKIFVFFFCPVTEQQD